MPGPETTAPETLSKWRRRSAVLLGAALVALLAAAVSNPARAYVAGGRTIWTIAGNGATCSPGDLLCGDGPSALDARLTNPSGIAVAPDGTVYIADTGAHRIRRLTDDGAISTVAGTGTQCAVPTSPCGDGGAGTAAQLASPRGLELARDGSLYIADSATNRIRRLSPAGMLTTVAGSGEPCTDVQSSCGDGGSAAAAMLSQPADIAVNPANGDIYVADAGTNRIRKVAGAGISTVAGTGAACAGPCGDGGPASGATLNAPSGVDLDVAQNVYVADTGSNRIRRVAATSGGISTVAGDGSPCALSTTPCGDGGPPTAGQLTGPIGVAVDGAVVYVADTGANKIRRVGSLISTLAGSGAACAQPPNCGDGGAAGAGVLSSPAAIVLDAGRDAFVADSADNLVRWLSGPGGGAPPSGGGGDSPPAAPAAEAAVAAEEPPAVAAPAVKRASKAKPGPLLRCNGSRCRLRAGRADAATVKKLRKRKLAARRKRPRARVELRRSRRTYATGMGRTLSLALTLVPVRQVRRGTYRLRITQTGPRRERTRDRIVKVR